MTSVTRFAKFHHFGKILKLSESFVSDGQNFRPTLANLLSEQNGVSERNELTPF